MVKFTQTYALRCGGSAIAAEEANILAKFDMIDANRFHYDDVNNDTWGTIRAINPNIVIFLYQTSRVGDDDDEKSIMFLNNVSRWNISRDHSMGNLNIDNPELFLLDSRENRIITPVWLTYVMDVGSDRWINYWLEATINDLSNQPWTADGVFIDVVPFRREAMGAMPVKYSSDEQFAIAQHKFLNNVAIGLGKKNQKMICNTSLENQFDFDEYVKLDNSYAPPFAMFCEGVFAVTWGLGDVQFFPVSRWKIQVDLMSQIHNFRVAYQSHTDLKPGGSGTDSSGKPVTYWDILWYSMASYHLGKNTVENNSYWGFLDSRSAAMWFDEYDYIDLGNAVGKYKTNNNIYYREFERGYVYVNPTQNDVSNIPLPEDCKQLTHTNFKNDPAIIPTIDTINLVSHRGTFLLKSDVGAAKGQIVNLDHPVIVEHGAACDINAAIKNIGDLTGQFKTQILLDGVLKATSPEFTLEGGATSTDKIQPFTAPLTGESMDIIIKCIRRE